MKAIDVNERREIISEFETDKENPTRFVIGVLKNRDKLAMVSEVMTDGKMDLGKLQTKAVDIFVAGVKEIKNIKVNDVPQDITIITKDTADLVPFQVLVEVVMKIIDENQVSEAEAKN